MQALLVVCWYAGNTLYNIYNKKATNMIHAHWFVATAQLVVGIVRVIVYIYFRLRVFVVRIVTGKARGVKSVAKMRSSQLCRILDWLQPSGLGTGVKSRVRHRPKYSKSSRQMKSQGLTIFNFKNIKK